MSFAAWGFGTLGRVRSLGVRIFGLRCLGIRNFGSAVFWLAGYLGFRYFGWSPFSGCLDPWASLLGGSEFWVYGILASWIFGPGSPHLVLGTWYLVVAYRGNGGIHRGIYQLQGDDNGHVGRPREVSPARPCPELLCELRGLCRHSYFGPRDVWQKRSRGIEPRGAGYPGPR